MKYMVAWKKKAFSFKARAKDQQLGVTWEPIRKADLTFAFQQMPRCFFCVLEREDLDFLVYFGEWKSWRKKNAFLTLFIYLFI